MDLLSELANFAEENGFREKGKLGVALIATQKCKVIGLPADPNALLTPNRTRVSGLSGLAVDRILRRHGIDRSLGTEVGRTSPMSAVHMQNYVTELNRLNTAQAINLEEVERFWIDRVIEYFARKPFVLESDPAFGVSGLIRNLIGKVEERQSETMGATLVGTVIQHLVGAKIEIALDLGIGEIARHGASVNDVSGRGGDLELGDTVIHVTTAPGQQVVEKCRQNLLASRRPIIVTGRNRVSTAEDLIADQGLAGRIDVLDYEQFLASNVFELGRFNASGRSEAITRIVDRYNAIVERVETDPSLRIEIR